MISMPQDVGGARGRDARRLGILSNQGEGARDSRALATDDEVRHSARTEFGVVVNRVAAWTPNDLTTFAPAMGMVQVTWGDESSPHWEYVAELTRA